MNQWLHDLKCLENIKVTMVVSINESMVKKNNIKVTMVALHNESIVS